MAHDLTQEWSLMILKVFWSVALRTFYQMSISLTCLVKLNLKRKKTTNTTPTPKNTLKVGAWGQERVTEAWNATFSHSAVLKPNLILQFPLKFLSKFLQPDDPLVMCFEISMADLQKQKQNRLKKRDLAFHLFSFHFHCTANIDRDHELESHGWKHFKWFPLTFIYLLRIWNLLQIKSNKEEESFRGFPLTALTFDLILSLDFGCQSTSLIVALTLQRKLLHVGKFFT